MTTTAHKKAHDWKCDDCEREASTLYYAGQQQICESCRKKRRRLELKLSVPESMPKTAANVA